MTEPDPYTGAWYRKRFAGMVWHMNRADADYASADERIVELEGKVESLETTVKDCMAEIGRLREELEERLQKVREAYIDLKTKNGS